MGKIKGTAMIEIVKGLRGLREAALEALPEARRFYVEDRVRVIPAGWYPDEDFLALAEALIAIMPEPGMEPWAWLGRLGASKDFGAGGVYGDFMKVGDPGESLRRFEEVWPLYHDEGAARVRPAGPQAAQVEIDHGLGTHDGFCRLQAEHLRTLLALAGAEDAKVGLDHVGDADRPACFSARW